MLLGLYREQMLACAAGEQNPFGTLSLHCLP